MGINFLVLVPATFSRRARTDSTTLATHELRHFIRLARVRLSHAPSTAFEDAARARASGEFPRAVEEFTRTPEMASRGGLGTTVGVLYIPSQALVVYPPIAILTSGRPTQSSRAHPGHAPHLRSRSTTCSRPLAVYIISKSSRYNTLSLSVPMHHDVEIPESHYLARAGSSLSPPSARYTP